VGEKKRMNGARQTLRNAASICEKYVLPGLVGLCYFAFYKRDPWFPEGYLTKKDKK